jgi:4-alpha-glucanotransferase
VVHFERDWEGGFKSAEQYPPDAYAVVGTHDMAPLAGFAGGRDLQLRYEVGLLSEEALRAGLQGRRSDWERLKARLQREGFTTEPGEAEIPYVCRALIQFLYRSPCVLAGVSLDDLAGEREPVNVPGVGPQQHASWSRRMTMTLEEIVGSPAIAEMVRADAPQGAG